MPRKVTLVLICVWVFITVFDYIWPNMGEMVGFFFLKTHVLLGWVGLLGFMAYQPL